MFKKYFDSYREKEKIPKELIGKIEGRLLPDQELLNDWRGKGLFWRDDKSLAVLMGKLDECFLTEDGFYLPADYKTKGGFILKEDAHKFHQNQLDTYTFLLKENGYKTKNCAYLIFFNPKEMLDDGLAKFTITPRRIETDPSSAKKIFQSAVKLLDGEMPKSHAACQYCSFVGTLTEFF